MNPEVLGVSDNQKQLAGTMHAYVTSFICNRGDPNALKTGDWRDRPVWEPYSSSSSGGQDEGQSAGPKTMIFGKGNEELIGGAKGVAAQCVVDDWAREQCDFWWDKVELTQQ
jgi:acetylcholinesterase